MRLLTVELCHCRHVQGAHLLVCGPYVYNHYLDCKDKDYYLSSDRINDVLSLSSSTSEDLSPILACQDCSLRLLQVYTSHTSCTHTHTHTPQDSELQYEVEVAGPPLCMAVYGEGGGGEEGEGSEMLYGTQTGRMGLVRLSSQEPHYCWDMLNERRSDTSSTDHVCV